MKASNYFILFFFLVFITHITSAQVIPSSRSANWKMAGYNGTIPFYSLIKNITDYGGSGDGIITNDAAIQNAIASLNDQNGIIYFPAGTFLFNAPVTLRNGLVLKGEGAANTTLQFNLAGAGNLITAAGSASGDTVNVTETALKDSFAISVDNISLFHVNDYVKIYQNDAALVNDSWALGSVGQILHIENIIGNRIYFSNPLRRNYLLTDVPKICRLTMVTGTGIECLKIKRMDATVSQASNIFFSNAVNCWVKGIESDSSNFAHIRIAGSTNIEISNSYFHGAFAYGDGGKGYGISCEYTSGECLVENNIFKHLRHSMLVQSGANGNVFGYNYSTQPFKTDSLPYDLSGDIVLHGNYPYLNLFEGNIVQNIIIDASHGINGPFNTLFRNRAELYGILIAPGAGDSSNIIGNEIDGTGFRQGNYYAQGNGNLEYGNNIKDVIIPAGTSVLPDKSYIHDSTPAFWNIVSGWPSVGIPNALSIGTIPAKQRFTISSTPVFCLPSSPVTYIFSGDGNWDVAANWDNNMIPPSLLSAGSKIIIDPSSSGKAVLNIPYVMNPGATLTIKPGKHFDVQSNLTLVK